MLSSGYSALTGVTMAFVLLLREYAWVALAFVVYATMFRSSRCFGTVTKRSLAGVGQFMFMGLIGLVITWMDGILVESDGLQP